SKTATTSQRIYKSVRCSGIRRAGIIVFKPKKREQRLCRAAPIRRDTSPQENEAAKGTGCLTGRVGCGAPLRNTRSPPDAADSALQPDPIFGPCRRRSGEARTKEAQRILP